MKKIRIGIIGYGNLAKGAELALSNPANQDMELVAIFTRRNPEKVKSASGVEVISFDNVLAYVGKIDVMILCGGSATDLPEQGPRFANYFNTVDSFDTHAKIPEYFKEIDVIAQRADTTAIISTGWDPGMFSIARGYAEAILPEGSTYTFWGPGISQGHSDAIRRIEGVKDARQYTIPIAEAMEKVRTGENPELSTRQKHLRDCYVVAKEGANLENIEKEIKEMPNYFADYDTTVHFISEAELKKNHSGMPHGGYVIRSGVTGQHKQTIEYSLQLESNPEFTGGILVAYARAAYNLNEEGSVGAKTVFDVPISALYSKEKKDLIKMV